MQHFPEKPSDRNAEIREWRTSVESVFGLTRVVHFDGPGGVRGDAKLEAIWDDMKTTTTAPPKPAIG